MTKFRIISDLHLEFRTYKNPVDMYSDRDYHTNTILTPTGDDKNQCLIISGDICPSHVIDRHSVFFDEISERFKHVVLIAGNHEFYTGETLPHTYGQLRHFYSSWKNFSFLQNDEFVFDGKKIFGGTLWTDFNNSDMTMKTAPLMIHDYKASKLTTEQVYREHKHTRHLIEQKDYDVVVTHHAPHINSVHEKYEGSQLNPLFYSDLSGLFERRNHKIWIHGHMHDCFDYRVNNTRVVCNPLAYPSENANCNKNLVIEL